MTEPQHPHLDPLDPVASHDPEATIPLPPPPPRQHPRPDPLDPVVSADPEATMPLPPPPPRHHPVHRPPAVLIAALAVGVLLAGGLLVVLLGRIGRDPAAAAESAPSRFPSPQALVEYLDRRGLSCDGYEAVDHSGNAERGRCSAGGHEVGVGVYPIHSDVEAQWAAVADTRAPVYMALGDNWTVDGPADWTKRVAEVMNVQFRARS